MRALFVIAMACGALVVSGMVAAVGVLIMVL